MNPWGSLGFVTRGDPTFGQWMPYQTADGSGEDSSVRWQRNFAYTDPNLEDGNIDVRSGTGDWTTPVGSGFVGVQLNGKHYYRVGDYTPNPDGAFWDPHSVVSDPTYGNIIPTSALHLKDTNSWLDNAMPFLAAAAFMGPAIGAAVGGAGATAAGAEGAGAAGDSLFGAGDLLTDPIPVGAAGGAATGGGGLLGTGDLLTDPFPGLGQASAGAGPDWASLGAGGGGLDPETLGGAGGMGVAQNGIGPGSLADILQGTLNNPASLLGRGADLLGGAGSYLLAHPLTALGLLQMGHGLLGGKPGGGGGGGGGGSAPLGLLGAPQKFYTNPYVLRQLQGSYGAAKDYQGY